jgi:hypothetical protein
MLACSSQIVAAKVQRFNGLVRHKTEAPQTGCFGSIVKPAYGLPERPLIRDRRSRLILQAEGTAFIE